jgi:hypothetical protein
MKKPFGGESPLNSQGRHYAMVHSGRAALRLLIISGLKKKKILLPDYLCAVIVDVMRQYRVPHDFYHINPDLTPDWDGIKGRHFDVLYVINYFGHRTKVPPEVVKKRTLLIDDIFAPIVDLPQGIRSWAVFNSFRKVTSLAEGALIVSNRPLKLSSIDPKPAAFAGLKYQAKQLKANYLSFGRGSRENYVRRSVSAEHRLDADKGINVPMMMTLCLLPQIYSGLEKEQGIRRHQYQVLDEQLRPYSMRLRPKYLSFYVIKVKERDALKNYLARQGVFVIAHWPASHGLNNPLYEQVLSIPLDSRYSDAQIRAVGQMIGKFLKTAE